MFLNYWETVLNIIQSSVTLIALIASGFLAYYKLFRGRIYHQKLELSVDCKSYLEKDSLIRLHITTVLKNLGLIIYGILKTRYQDLAINVVESKRVYLGAFSLFGNHQWIESSEIIQDQKFIESKSDYSAFMVEAIVMSTKQQWYSSCISVVDVDDNRIFNRQREDYAIFSAGKRRRNSQADRTAKRGAEEKRGANAATATRA